MKITDKAKKQIIVIATAIIFLLIILSVCVFDNITHGFFCETPTYSQIVNEQMIEKVDISKIEQEQKFKICKNRFAGFEIMLTDVENVHNGKLNVVVLNEKSDVIEQKEIELSSIKNNNWYVIQLTKKLQKDTEYKLVFSVNGEAKNVNMFRVKDVYLPNENVDGNLLIEYGYHQETFKLGERCFIAFALITVWLLISTNIISNSKVKKIIKITSIFIIMATILAWNYIYNSIDNKNTGFEKFQDDSEALVIGMIEAKNNKLSIPFRYGLGRYYNSKGAMFSYNELSKSNYINNGDWKYGYSKTKPIIVLAENRYTQRVAIKGNSIKFSNGKELKINKVTVNGNYREIHLDTDEVLKYDDYGKLEDARYYNSQGKELETGMISEYPSQYGLQGKIFSRLYKYVYDISDLNLLCAICTAIVFTIIVFLIARKYNLLMAGCFYITFLLSPWVINFARNLYWVEFTWFIPMIAGLICSIWIDKKWCRILSYVMVFLSILVKCLCGYEYITTIMLGMISFLLVDLIVAFVKKDRKKANKILITTIIIGVVALLAFCTAIIIHANIKGNGNIIQGIKTIIQNDLLRRTNGADLNDFSQEYWYSFNASIWATIRKYCHFSTEIITGIDGNMFAIISILPLIIIINNLKKKKYEITDISLYIVFLITTISWHILAKSHSFVHITMNYVLWYFGYIQICFYIILKQVINYIKDNRVINKDIKNNN